ncbi:DUF4344 domain-containing metallopeptidase [Streptomyces sp. NPDC091272]|uniref:DUF4344 domain-containing metallopeptidase n=1 Tax=Streptomyces sp. NPDC091272 TaxID=3365981 RepID=UPI0038169685
MTMDGDLGDGGRDGDGDRDARGPWRRTATSSRTRSRTRARIRTRTRRAAVATAVALAAAGGAACQGPAVPAPGPAASKPAPTVSGSRPAVSVPRQVVTVRYEDPAPADRDDAGFLRGQQTAEAVAADLAGFLDWGDRAPVPLVVRSCAGEGPSYDPEARRIEICYDEITETRQLFREAARRQAEDGDLRSIQLETLFHESAHALIDVLGLGLAGNEEDLADQFAALMLLRNGASGERQLRITAEAWRMSAELYVADEEATGDEEATEGEEATGDDHAPDLARAVNQLCYLYGAAPGRHRDVLGTAGLPTVRAAGCAQEWNTARTRWTQALRAAGALRGPTDGPGTGG